jgi:hypothetical protein
MMKRQRKPLEKKREATGNFCSFRRFKFKNGEILRGTGIGISNESLSLFGVENN